MGAMACLVALAPLPVLREHHAELFAAMMDNSRGFWTGLDMEADPRMHDHPVRLLPPGWEDHTMPLSLHGDAGTFTRGGESIVVVSWASVLHRANTWDSLFLAAAIPKSAICTGADGDTLGQLWAHLAADFRG